MNPVKFTDNATRPVMVGLWFLMMFCEITSGAASSAIDFNYRRRPTASFSDNLRQDSHTSGSRGPELAARLRRLESAVAMHHSGIHRQLQAITAHLASSNARCAGRDTGLTQLVTSLTHQVASLSKQDRRDQETRQAESAQLRQLTRAARSQARALMSLRAQLMSKSIQQHIEHVGEQVDLVGADLHRLRTASVKQEANISEKIEGLHQVVATNLEGDSVRNTQLFGEVANVVSLLESVGDQVNASTSQILQEHAVQNQAAVSILNEVGKAREGVTSMTTHLQAGISEEIRQQFANGITTLNGLLEDTRNLINATASENRMQIEQIQDSFAQEATSRGAQLESISSVLIQLGGQLNETVDEVTSGGNVVQQKLDALEDLQSDTDTTTLEIEESLEQLTQLQSKSSFRITETLSKLSNLEQMDSDLANAFDNVLRGVDALSGSVESSIAKLKTNEAQNFAKLQESIESFSMAANNRLSSLAAAQNSFAHEQRNITLSAGTMATSLEALSQTQHGLATSLSELQDMLRMVSEHLDVSSALDAQVSTGVSELGETQAQSKKDIDNILSDLGEVKSKLIQKNMDVVDQISTITENVDSILRELVTLSGEHAEVGGNLEQDSQAQSVIDTLSIELRTFAEQVENQLHGIRHNISESFIGTTEQLRQVQDRLKTLEVIARGETKDNEIQVEGNSTDAPTTPAAGTIELPSPTAMPQTSSGAGSRPLQETSISPAPGSAHNTSTVTTTQTPTATPAATPQMPTATTEKPTTTTTSVPSTTTTSTPVTTTTTTTTTTTRKPISFLDALLESLRKREEAKLKTRG